eukprot:TRINITY_DN50_c0_g5_i2.p1 TRINITY_DN50_c0_g5~~TRINITY_DN50_c0_g5_i2.p1  ORF type:complete len:1015 (-),score=363.90 TRINITY_DN50_c0_g5_i2:317-3361(-)
MSFHSLTVNEVLDHFQVDPENGLSESQVAQQKEKFGLNELDKEEKTPLWKLVLEQFEDLMVIILIFAALVSFALACFEDSEEGLFTRFIEPLVICFILLANAIVGVWQESNAESALDALKELQSEHAKVYRGGVFHPEMLARDLVPGDIVEVKTGDKIPADLRVIKLKTTTFRAEQSSLTGESQSVSKFTDTVENDTDITGKKNLLFSGTGVANGACVGVVVATGMATEIGIIQASVTEAKEEDSSTPLKIKIDEFGEKLAQIIFVICVLVWVINWSNFSDPVHGGFFKGCLYYFSTAVALAVAAIPEGLPAVITTCLALGTRKMAKKNAIVRKLPSVETLGCVSVICSDKTGTLTTNQMSVISLVYIGDSATDIRQHKVSGTTYEPKGAVENMPFCPANNIGLHQLLRTCTFCNEARIEFHKNKFKLVGEPTEGALKVLVEKLSVDDDKPTDSAARCKHMHNFWSKNFNKLATLEFTRDRKSMSVICKNMDTGINTMFVKGAPEEILARSSKVMLSSGQIVPLADASRAAITAKINEMAGQALRCLAMAYTDECHELAQYDGSDHHPAHRLLENPDNFKNLETGLTFTGLCGIVDPPRPEVRDSIDICRQAGIRVIVITGDNQKTAESVCRQIGVFGADEDLSDKSFIGREFFNNKTEEEQEELLRGTTGLVFSRTEPKHKQQLVRILKDIGEITAMTGDGVNDSPALQAADIGIAMGKTGTEVAKEASDMILADDNFSTIVSAVEEGRSIYNNTKAFIRYLISSNIGEVASIFLSAALGLPEAFLPVQLLWVNLVTDGPPAVSLGFNPADKDIMTKKPRKATDPLISGWVFFRYMVIGLWVGIATVGVFAHWYMYYEHPDNHSLVTFNQLSNWSECPEWENFEVNNFGNHDFTADACKYFTDGKVKASTMSLSVLVTIEMLNALNAISEDGSLFSMPPWVNPWLLLAMCLSFGLHFLILYVPVLANIFSIVPLDFQDWMLVLLWSVPVVVLDEILKCVGRFRNNKLLKERLN